MARCPDDWVAQVASRAKGVVYYVNRMERLYDDRLSLSAPITNTDVDRAFAGGFLLFYAYLERAVECYFVGLLTGHIVHSDPSVHPRVIVKSYPAAYEIVHGGRSYADWFPYGRHTRPRAKAFFTGGRPFTNMAKTEIKALDHVGIIRHALAHGGSASLRGFKEIVGDKALPPRQRRPAGYLRGYHMLGQTRFEYLLARAVAALRSLT